METAYAQALWNIVSKGGDAKKAVHSLKETLTAHGREKLLPRIAKAFERLAERNAHRTDVVVSVADEKDERRAHAAAKEALAGLGMEAKHLKTQVDETLVGGWRLEGQETLVDASYKKDLLELFNRATR